MTEAIIGGVFFALTAVTVITDQIFNARHRYLMKQIEQSMKREREAYEYYSECNSKFVASQIEERIKSEVE